MYVCICVCLPLLIYLIPYKERFLKGAGVWAICPRLDVPRHAGLFQGTTASCRFPFQRCSLDPLSFRKLPMETTVLPNKNQRPCARAICELVVHSIA